MHYKWNLLLIFCTLTAHGHQSGQSWTQRNVREIAEAKVEKFKLDLQRIFEDRAEHFNSSIADTPELVPNLSSQVLEIGVECVITGGFLAEVSDSETPIIMTTTNNTLFMLSDFKIHPIGPFLTENVLSLQVFACGGQNCFITHRATERDGYYIEVRELNLTEPAIHSGQRLRLDGPTTVSITGFSSTTYMAVATRTKISSMLTLYRWERSQFDEVFSHRIDNLSTLDIFYIQEALYIAASYIEKKHLVLKKYVESSQTMDTIQLIDVEAKIIGHFKHLDDYYLVSGTINSLVIYRWAGTQFLQDYRMVFGNTINDIAIHTFSGKVVIAVAFDDEVKFLVTDHFSGYILAGRVGFNQKDRLKSMLLWKQNSFLYLLPIFKGNNSPVSVHRIILDFELSDAEMEPPYEGCLQMVYDRVSKRQKEIDEFSVAVEDRWSTSNGLGAVSLKVNGSIKSFTNVTVGRLDVAGVSPSYLRQMVKSISYTIEKLKKEISKSVIKSKVEFMRGTFTFKNLSLRRATIVGQLGTANINKVDISRLPSALRKSGNQELGFYVMANHVWCNEANVIMLLNGNRMDDYMLLNSTSLNLTGLSFFDVSAKELRIGSHKINGLDMRNLVLTSSDRHIHGTKSFTSISAISVSSSESKMKEIKEMVDAGDFTKISLQFKPLVKIEGNLNINTLNNYDILHLFSKSMRKDMDQVIHGRLFFKSVNINADVNIEGRVNKCDLNELMTLHTDQTINGPVSLARDATFQDILTDSLNGVDLSEQAVTQFHGNRIGGVKTFAQTMFVSSVTLKEGALIDSFDPSLQIPEVLYKLYDENTASTYHFHKDVTIGDVIAETLDIDVDFFPILGEINNFWLRTTKQNISSLDVCVMNASSLQVEKVNGMGFEDFVRIDDDVTLSGPIKFKDRITTKSVESAKGSDFDFFAGYGHLKPKIKLKSNITLESAVFEGDIDVNRVSDTPVANFLLVDKFKEVNDEVYFENIFAKELIAKDLKFQFFNDLNFTDFFMSSVVPSQNRTIKNKRFLSLAGTSMKCNGTLNSVSINRVARTDTEQKITSTWTFANDILLKEAYVKAFPDEIALDDVVLTDEITSVSNKKFNGYVVTANLNTSGNINGVNITDLKINAFNKSRNNNVTERIRFQSNLMAKQLQVIGSKIDDVDLRHVILLKNAAILGTLNASSIVATNVTLLGDLNKCKWMPVLQDALLHHQTTQDVTSKVFVKSLVVDGNLTLGYFNKAPISGWISMLSRLSEPDLSKNIVFEDLKAQNVQFSMPVNNTSVAFLLDDAVRSNVTQVITGKKNFVEFVAVNLTVQALNTAAPLALNLSDLIETSITRHNSRSHLTTRTLKGLKARQVIVKGKVNSLILPDDVILTNTREVIFDEVFINGTVNATSGLNVGTLNRRSLERFLEERVSLSDSEEIFSTLIITEDAILEGNTVINGTVNGISLDDVVKVDKEAMKATSGHMTINGSKVFEEALRLVSDLSVHGSVNELLLQDFLWRSRDESVKHVQFSKLIASSLDCGNINGLSVAGFYDHAHEVLHYIDDKVHNFTADIFSYGDVLTLLQESIESSSTFFEYFEMHDTFNYGIIKRFITVYNNKTDGEKDDSQVTRMIMWVDWNKNSCKKTKSLVADVLQNGTFKVPQIVLGKIFSFSLKDEKNDVVGFDVQAEPSPKCMWGSNNYIQVKTLYSSGVAKSEMILSPKDSTVIDVQLLELDDIYLLIVYDTNDQSERVFVHLFDPVDNTWSEQQAFHTEEVTSVQIVDAETDEDSLFEGPIVYMSLTGGKDNPGVTVYEWDFENIEFFLKTNMSTSVSTSTLWFDHHKTLFLLLAKEKTTVKKDTTWVNIYTEPLEVYALEDEFYLSHTVNVKGVTSLELFILEEEAFVLASSNHMELVYVLQYRGHNGFEIIQEIPAPGVTETKIYTAGGDLYLVLNSRTGQSRILKASIRGRRSKDSVSFD